MHGDTELPNAVMEPPRAQHRRLLPSLPDAARLRRHSLNAESFRNFQERAGCWQTCCTALPLHPPPANRQPLDTTYALAGSNRKRVISAGAPRRLGGPQ